MLDALTDRRYPPYLWGEWRANATPEFFTAWCAACGADLWVCWSAGRWRVTCAGGCTLDAIDAAATNLADAQAARRRYDEELRATMEPDDLFYGFGATDYIARLTGQEPARGGFFRCPFHADGQERTPSLHATDLLPGRWYCHGCHEGGTIYDFAALLWGIEPRADGFTELRQRLVMTFNPSAGVDVLTWE